MLTELIITIAVIVLLPIIFGVVFLARVWEERKMRINESFCIRLPKLITVFFAVFGILFFLGMIGVLIGYCLDDSMPLSYFLLAEGLILFILILFGVGFYSVLSYRIVVFTDKVVVKYPFCKPKTFSFEEIAYYSLYGNNFADIQCYDEYGITLFSVSRLLVGSDAFFRLLTLREVPAIDFPFPKEEFLHFPRYRLFRNKQRAKAIFFSALFCGVVFLLMGLLVMSLLNVKTYTESATEGYVESFTLKEDNFTLTLRGDGSTYFLNNIVYDALDKSFVKELEQGIFVRLQIGYTDENGRKNIVGIEYLGKVYLKPQAAEAAESSNYQSGRTMMFVFYGIGGALILISVLPGVRFRRYSAAYRAAGNGAD